ncbi:MAG: glycine betaine ABC transporter substrate-binding protein, partial [Acidimicrobiales bacterium]
DFSGIDVNVGSKDFTEQIVLGEILVQTLEAKGATVTNNTNLGGTVVNRDALLSGEIDTYWEYNGTGWTVHLANEDPSFDSQTLSTDVCVNDLAENNIRWVGVSPFNDPYRFATA